MPHHSRPTSPRLEPGCFLGHWYGGHGAPDPREGLPSLALPSRTMFLEAFIGFRNLFSYHSIYRSLYYAPLAVAAVRYGQRGGALIAEATSTLYLPMCDCTGQRLHQLLPKA
jgi:hypothetical protein